MPIHIPTLDTRSGKTFYMRMSMMIVGIAILIYVLNKDSSKVIHIELATIILAVCSHALLKEGSRYLIPCKNIENPKR